VKKTQNKKALFSVSQHILSPKEKQQKINNITMLRNLYNNRYFGKWEWKNMSKQASIRY
jgi:hypothetical protein